MAAKRILLFDGIRILAHVASRGRIEAEQEFAPDPEGMAAFAAYLGARRSSLFYLLADVSDEGFQIEDIPAVQGGDRAALIARRLGQYFYGTRLTTALSLGRTTSGDKKRRNEKMLFAALTRQDTLMPWLDVLHESGGILAGIYSVPLVLAASAPRWLDTKHPALLITPTTGGIRQSFFDQGKLYFSRLTPLALRDATEIARTSASESFKIHQYLVGQRLITADTLHTYILAPRDQRRSLEEYCRDSAKLHFEFIELEVIARQNGLSSLDGGFGADRLLMHSLARKAPPQQFAPAAERHFFRLWQIRFALHAAAAVVLFGGLLFATKSWLDTQAQQQDIATLQARTALTSRQYDQLIGSLPKVGLSSDNLRAMMARYAELEKHSPEMTPLLAHLSHALDDMPKIELLGIDWEITPQLKVGAGGTAPTAAMSAMTPAGIAPVPAAGPWAALTVKAQLPPALASDLRAQKNLIDAFAERLRDPQTTIRVLAMPFDVESAKPLKSTTETDAARSDQTPVFSLLIARPL